MEKKIANNWNYLTCLSSPDFITVTIIVITTVIRILYLIVINSTTVVVVTLSTWFF